MVGSRVQSCRPVTRTSDQTLTPTTWPTPTSSCSPSNAAGATSRARLGCARCTTTGKTASAATSNYAGSHCFSSVSPRTPTGDTWRNLRHELDRMHLVTLATGDGRVAQRTTSTAGRRPSSPRSTCPNQPSSSSSPSPTPDRPATDDPGRVVTRPNQLRQHPGRSAYKFTESCAHELRKSGLGVVPTLNRQYGNDFRNPDDVTPQLIPRADAKPGCSQ